MLGPRTHCTARPHEIHWPRSHPTVQRALQPPRRAGLHPPAGRRVAQGYRRHGVPEPADRRQHHQRPGSHRPDRVAAPEGRQGTGPAAHRLRTEPAGRQRHRHQPGTGPGIGSPGESRRRDPQPLRGRDGHQRPPPDAGRDAATGGPAAARVDRAALGHRRRPARPARAHRAQLRRAHRAGGLERSVGTGRTGSGDRPAAVLPDRQRGRCARRNTVRRGPQPGRFFLPPPRPRPRRRAGHRTLGLPGRRRQRHRDRPCAHRARRHALLLRQPRLPGALCVHAFTGRGTGGVGPRCLGRRPRAAAATARG
mmetsp:Transcript_6619/g.27536  ORF Transcript_6619/g.27536 Transcript_6619/m.27536 type:complete len:309 (+) Transcript_6619:2974-3900(+)